MIVSGRQLGLGLQAQVSIPRYGGGAANVICPTSILEELTAIAGTVPALPGNGEAEEIGYHLRGMRLGEMKARTRAHTS